MSGWGDEKRVENSINNETNLVGYECDHELIGNVEVNVTKSLKVEKLYTGCLSEVEPEETTTPFVFNSSMSIIKSFCQNFKEIINSLMSAVREKYIASYKREERREKLSSGSHSNPSPVSLLGIGIGLLFFFACIPGSYQCPSADLSLNPPNLTIGEKQTITCSFQLDSCIQIFWFLNETILSSSDGYRISDLHNCAGTISFSVSSIHENGAISCVIERNLGNGIKENCSSTIVLPEIAKGQDNNSAEDTTTDTGWKVTMTPDYMTLDDHSHAKAVIGSSTEDKNYTEAETKDVTLHLAVGIVLGIIGLVVGCSTIQMVFAAVYHCKYGWKRKFKITNNNPQEDEEIQGQIDIKINEKQPYPLQETGADDEPVIDVMRDGLNDTKILPHVDETSLVNNRPLLIVKRGHLPKFSKHALSRHNEGNGEDREKNEVALDIEVEESSDASMILDKEKKLIGNTLQVALNVDDGGNTTNFEVNFEESKEAGLLPPPIKNFT